MKLAFVRAVLFVFACSFFSCDSSGGLMVVRTPQEQLELDLLRIEGYLEENDLEGFQSTDSGLHYRIEEAGDSRFPQDGERVFVEILGTTVERLAFTLTAENEPFEAIIGSGDLVQGLDEGLLLLGQGGTATFIVPSTLGFGMNSSLQETFALEPNTILIYRVTLLSIG